MKKYDNEEISDPNQSSYLRLLNRFDYFDKRKGSMHDH